MEARYLGIDGSIAKALITPCLLLIWRENSYGEESKEPSRQWEREHLLAVRLGEEVRAAVALIFRVHRFGEWCVGFFALVCFCFLEDWDVRRLMAENWDTGVTKPMRE